MLELESKSLTRECGDGSCRSYKISVNFLNALHIFRVCVAKICPAFFRTDACTTTLGSDGCWGNCQRRSCEVGCYCHTVHTDDVGHCEKCSESGADFGKEVAPLSLFALQE